MRIAGRPSALDCLQFLEPRRKDFTQLLEILQRFGQIAQFVHQIDFREKADALVAKFRAVAQPLPQDAMPRRGRLIHAAARPALRGRFTAAEQPFALQALQCRVDLAEFGGPEIMDALAEDRFQVVAARGLAKQAEQDVVQAHADHYITVYINSNCYSHEGHLQLAALPSGNVCRLIQVEWPWRIDEWTLFANSESCF